MRLVVTQGAEADLASARQWYDAQGEGLGREFLLTVDEQLQRILDAPGAYPIVRHEVRRALVKRFPYAVFYVVDSDAVVILIVSHQARDPDHWQSRLRR